MEKSKNVLYIDDDVSKYMRKELNKLKIPFEKECYLIQCEYMTFKAEDLNIVEKIVKKIQSEDILCVFIDSKLYVESKQDRTNGILIAYILKGCFPFLNVFIVSSQTNSVDAMASNTFKFLKKFDKENDNELVEQYISEITNCIKDEREMKRAISYFTNTRENGSINCEIEDEMQILLDKINNKFDGNFLTNESFEKIIKLLEEAIDNE